MIPLLIQYYRVFSNSNEYCKFIGNMSVYLEQQQ